VNYDTILPPRIRTELLNKPKRFKLWHKIAIGLVLLIGLRHLNTLPHREWVNTWHTGGQMEDQIVSNRQAYDPNLARWVDASIHKQVQVPLSNHSKRVYTAEGLFGSSYQAEEDGNDLGFSSKRLGDVFLKTFGPTDQNLKILRAIDP